MANDRIGALEGALQDTRQALESNRERRDSQIGELAVEITSNTSHIEAINQRLRVIEDQIKPPSVIAVWGPALATIGLVASVGGAFLAMTQREQDAKMASHEYKIEGLRIDSRYMDEQGRVMERDFRGRLSAVEARQQMLEHELERMADRD